MMISEKNEILVAYPAGNIDSANAADFFEELSGKTKEHTGQMLEIDMSAGHPIFDLAGLYVAYRLFREDDEGNSMRFLGIPYESLDIIWNTVFNRYYGDLDEDSAKKRMSEIEMLGVIYFLSIIVEPGIRDDELGSIRLDKSIDRLRRAVGL